MNSILRRKFLKRLANSPVLQVGFCLPKTHTLGSLIWPAGVAVKDLIGGALRLVAKPAFPSKFSTVIGSLLFGVAVTYGLGEAQATLFDRGGGLLYDDVLNVTFLQDANYAKTSGYDEDGLMDWTTANTWAADLDYGGYSNWRLASVTPVSADWNYSYSSNGITDYGYNITSPHSELSFMYYVNLGLKGYYSPEGIYRPDFGVFSNGTGSRSAGDQVNVGLVNNLKANFYWTGTTYVPSPANGAWFFDANSGYQHIDLQQNQFHAWAVLDGDVVVAVPEPDIFASLLAGLAFLGVAAKRRRKQKHTA
jgi:hypothetical protein